MSCSLGGMTGWRPDRQPEKRILTRVAFDTLIARCTRTVAALALVSGLPVDILGHTLETMVAQGRAPVAGDMGALDA